MSEAVHGVHHAAGVGFASDAVESGQQRASGTDSTQGDVGVEQQAGGVVGTEPCEFPLHAGFEFTGEEFREIGSEGSVGRAQETGSSAVAYQRSSLHQVDKRRRGVIGRTQQSVDHAADRRSAALPFQLVGPVSTLALKRVVATGRSDERADVGEPVGHRGDLGEQFADLESVQAGLDR